MSFLKPLNEVFKRLVWFLIMCNSKTNTNAYHIMQGFRSALQKKISTINPTLHGETEVWTGHVNTPWQ